MKFDNSLQLAHYIAKVSNAEIASHNQYYLSECPYCGNDNHSHISSRFGETNVGTFFKCFACGKATSIYMLGVKLGIINPDEDEEPEETVIKPLVKQSSLPDWWNKRWHLLEQYQNNREKIYMWAQYKNVRPDEIEKYALGYGYLPHTTTPRLIVPVFDGKELIGFRGRLVDNPEGNQVKWLSTKGLSPSNMKNPPFYSRAKDYSHLFVVENMVDAILVNERTPHTAIPTMSVTYWNESWTEKIRELLPISVIVAYDADLAGNGCGKEIMRELIQKRLRKLSLDCAEVNSYAIRGNNLEIKYVNSVGDVLESRIPSPYGIRLYKKLSGRVGAFTHLADWSAIDQNIKDVGELIGKRKAI